MIFQKHSIGMEFDGNEIRAVEMLGSSKMPKLHSWGSYTVPEDYIKDGIILDPENVANSIIEMWSHNKFSKGNIILGVSNQDVIVRFANLPVVSHDKLDKLVKYQAQDFLPVPVDTVILDYMDIGRSIGNEGPQIDILLVAARKNMIEGYIAAINKAKLKLKDIVVSSFSLPSYIKEIDKESTIAIVNLGNESTNVLIIGKQTIQLSRLISYGITNYSKAIINNDSVNTGADTAIPNRPPEEELNILSDALSSEIRSSIAYYQSKERADVIKTMYLSGIGSNVPGIEKQLEEKTGLGIQVYDPLYGVYHTDSGNISIVREAHKYAISISLSRYGLED